VEQFLSPVGSAPANTSYPGKLVDVTHACHTVAGIYNVDAICIESNVLGALWSFPCNCCVWFRVKIFGIETGIVAPVFVAFLVGWPEFENQTYHPLLGIQKIDRIEFLLLSL
jgi:hypothetical protein